MIGENIIFQFIYRLFWGAFIIVEFLTDCCTRLNQNCFDYLYKLCDCDDFEYVRENVKHVKKLPIHLTVLLNEEAPSYQDLANIIRWSLASGISFVSFFDHKGVLKHNELELKEATEKKGGQSGAVLWYDGEKSYRSAIVAGKNVYVRMLSVSDGRRNIIKTAKLLCNNNNDAHAIDQETIDTCLKDNYLFPDPDLGLYTGKVFRLFGYPPWEIRITEFIGIGTHRNLKARTFVRALCKYGKTEQRLGK